MNTSPHAAWLVPVLLTLPAVAQEPAAEAPSSPEPDPELLALFEYDRGAPIDIAESESRNLDGYRVADITYASHAGGRVPAYLYEPEGAGPHAGLILMHGLPGSREDMTGFAEGYVRTGAVVLVISAPWARPDGPNDPIVSFTRKDRAQQIQLIQDLRRGVDLLQSFPWVDKERIGYVGGSYGGAMGGLLAGVEHRIKAFALMVGDGGLVDHFSGADDEDTPDGVSQADFRAWVEMMQPIEPIQLVRFAAPSKLLFQNGRTDPFVPAADAELYHRAASEPKKIIWYETGHGITPEMQRDQLKWLAAEIGIDPTKFP